jgi:hypothetical protein
MPMTVQYIFPHWQARDRETPPLGFPLECRWQSTVTKLRALLINSVGPETVNSSVMFAMLRMFTISLSQARLRFKFGQPPAKLTGLQSQFISLPIFSLCIRMLKTFVQNQPSCSGPVCVRPWSNIPSPES